jgi:PadR family transcriptional regulator PadR
MYQVEINVQFKKGILELCVLVLIERKDHYGYELAHAISSHFQVAEGAIYPLLRRLVIDKYCTTYLQESNEGPPRKYYKLTASGKQMLKQSIAEWNFFSKSVNNIIKEGGNHE